MRMALLVLVLAIGCFCAASAQDAAPNAAAPNPEGSNPDAGGSDLYEGQWKTVEVDPSEAGECTFCGTGVEIAAGGEVIWHRGRKIHLCANPACHDHWLADPGTAFRAFQPQGGLWDEPVPIASALSKLWLVVGLWVLLGLITGSLCAYLSIPRGQPPLTWFLIGLGVNVIGLGLLLTRRSPVVHAPEGVPSGLRKVPTTRTPLACKGCGLTNHPSAAECPGCGAALAPSSPCEVDQV